jgi:hypothetical protein
MKFKAGSTCVTDEKALDSEDSGSDAKTSFTGRHRRTRECQYKEGVESRSVSGQVDLTGRFPYR